MNKSSQPHSNNELVQINKQIKQIKWKLKHTKI